MRSSNKKLIFSPVLVLPYDERRIKRNKGAGSGLVGCVLLQQQPGKTTK